MAASSLSPGFKLWIALLALPAAALLAVLLGVGTAAVAPSPLAAYLTAALLVAGLFFLRRLPAAVDPLLVLIAALGAGWLLWRPGFPNGHDVLHHIWGLYAFGEAVREGDLFPRWLHHLGLGLPLLQFYPPGSFYLALPLLLVGLSPVATLKGLLLLSSMLAGLAMYVAVRSSPASRSAAVVAAVAYSWAPYAQFDRLYRVALAESVALILAPLVLSKAIGALRSRAPRDLVLAGAWLALLTLTHPLATSMIGTALALWIVIEWWPPSVGVRRSAATLSRFLLLSLVAALLAAFYLLPVAAETRYTSIHEAVQIGDRPAIAKHGLTVEQLFTPRRWDRWRMSQPTGSEADQKGHEPPFYVGLPLLAALLLAPLLLRPLSSPLSATEATDKDAYSRSPADRTALALGVLGLTSLVLCVRPFNQILALAPWWRILQFPWRWLFVATLAGAWCAGLVCERLQQLADARWPQTFAPALVPALLALTFVVDGAAYDGSPSWYAPYQGVVLETYDRAACDSGGDCWSTHPLELEGAPEPIRLYADPGVPLLPPSEPGTGVGLVIGAYPEYYTPAIKGMLTERSQLPRSLPLVGVSWVALRGASEAHRLAAPAPYAEWRGPQGRTAAVPFERGRGRITLTDLPPGPGVVVVHEQYFPGWRVGRRGRDEAAESTAEGFLTARVEPQQTWLRFYFTERRWDRAIGWALSALTLAAIMLLWLFRARRSPAAALPPPSRSPH